MAITRILVPVDYSQQSKAALSYAMFLAKPLGVEVDVVHVWDRPNYVPDTVVVAGPGGHQSVADLIRENAEKEMDDFLGQVDSPAGVTVTHHLESGEPASTILRTAERTESSMVVMGTHGRTGVRYLLLGSVAEKLVRLCPIPVLTVPTGSPD